MLTILFWEYIRKEKKFFASATQNPPHFLKKELKLNELERYY